MGFFKDLFCRKKGGLKLLVLTAGYATRLYPLTLDTPKPLLDVGGKTMLDRILEKVADSEGVGDIVIVTNGKFFDNFRLWAKRSPYRNRISLVNDETVTNETRLGAIKDIELAITKKKIDGDLLVVAGDNLFELDMEKLLQAQKKNPESMLVALHDIGDLESAKRYGVVQIDANNKIIDFEEKPESPKSTLISTGIYYIPKSRLSTISELIASQASRVDQPGLYVKWMCRREPVYGFSFSEDWYDIGDMESYKSACKEYEQKERGVK